MRLFVNSWSHSCPLTTCDMKIWCWIPSLSSWSFSVSCSRYLRLRELSLRSASMITAPRATHQLQFTSLKITLSITSAETRACTLRTRWRGSRKWHESSCTSLTIQITQQVLTTQTRRFSLMKNGSSTITKSLPPTMAAISDVMPLHLLEQQTFKPMHPDQASPSMRTSLLY